MVLTADAVAQAEDLGRRVGCIAPCPGLLEITVAGVTGLEIEKRSNSAAYLVAVLSPWVGDRMSGGFTGEIGICRQCRRCRRGGVFEIFRHAGLVCVSQIRWGGDNGDIGDI